MPLISQMQARAAKKQDALLALQPRIVPDEQAHVFCASAAESPRLSKKGAQESLRIREASAFVGTFGVTLKGSTANFFQNEDTREKKAVSDFSNVLNGAEQVVFPCRFSTCFDSPLLLQIGDGSLAISLFFVEGVPYDSSRAMTTVLSENLSGFGVREGYFNVASYPQEGREKISKWLVFYSEYRDLQGSAIESSVDGIPSSIYRSVTVKGLIDGQLYPPNPVNFKSSSIGVFFTTSISGHGDYATTQYMGARFGDPLNGEYPGIRVDRIGVQDAVIKKSGIFAYPNPHASGQIVSIEALSKAQGAQCTVYDLHGRAIRVLEDEGAGERRAYYWDGLDSSGQIVPAGVYFAAVEGQKERAKIVRLR